MTAGNQARLVMRSKGWPNKQKSPQLAGRVRPVSMVTAMGSFLWTRFVLVVISALVAMLGLAGPAQASEVQVAVAVAVAVDLIHLLALTLFRQTSSSPLIASMPPAMILRSI